MAAPAQEDRSGTVLDAKYVIVRRVGAGGMGEVYEALNRHIGRRVAIKFLAGRYAERPDLVARFENEARAAGSLVHENIATVFDSGQAEGGVRYLVMEFLDGEDCARLLRRHSHLSPERAAELVIQVCRGLAVAHDAGIVHRDLKPANLFLTRRADGRDLVKILDFGIAKLQSGGHTDLATTPGTVFGTPFYMSPEQARGSRALDQRTDLYSLGVILYEMLSGRRPHDGVSQLELVYRIATAAAAPLEDVRPDLPLELARVVSTAMAPDVESRFASASALADALLPFVQPESVGVAPATGRASSETTRTSLPSVPHRITSSDSLSPPTTHAPLAPSQRTVAPALPSRHRRVALFAAIAVTALALELSRERLQRAATSPSDAATAPAASTPSVPSAKEHGATEQARTSNATSAPQGESTPSPPLPILAGSGTSAPTSGRGDAARARGGAGDAPLSGARARSDGANVGPGMPATFGAGLGLPLPGSGASTPGERGAGEPSTGSATSATSASPEPAPSASSSPSAAAAAPSSNPSAPPPGPPASPRGRRLEVDPNNPYR